MPVLGQIWPFLGLKSNFLGAGSKTFGALISGNQWDTSFVLKTLTSEAPTGRYTRKSAILTQKFGYWGQKSFFLFWNLKRRILAQNPIFYLGNPIFVDGTFVALCVGSIFAFGPSQYLFSFSSCGHFSPRVHFFWKSFPSPTVGLCLWLTALACTARRLDKSSLSLLHLSGTKLQMLPKSSSVLQTSIQRTS